MIRAALVGMSTVVGVGAVLSYQPAAEVVGAAVAPVAQEEPPSAPPAAAPAGTTATPPSEPEPTGTSAAASPTARPSTSGSTESAAPTAKAQATASQRPAATSRPSSSSPAPSTPRATPTPTASASPTRSATPTPTPTDVGPQTWTGAAAVTPYGNVQVALVVDGGVIVDAYALQFPSEHPTSREIASYALPELRRQTLEAQSAAIAGVSGASYDTAGWITSLQSALSRAAL